MSVRLLLTMDAVFLSSLSNSQLEMTPLTAGDGGLSTARHVSAAYAKGAVRCLDLVGPFTLRARSKSEGAACRFDSNAAGRFI